MIDMESFSDESDASNIDEMNDDELHNSRVDQTDLTVYTSVQCLQDEHQRKYKPFNSNENESNNLVNVLSHRWFPERRSDSSPDNLNIDAPIQEYSTANNNILSKVRDDNNCIESMNTDRYIEKLNEYANYDRTQSSNYVESCLTADALQVHQDEGPRLCRTSSLHNTVGRINDSVSLAEIDVIANKEESMLATKSTYVSTSVVVETTTLTAGDHKYKTTSTSSKLAITETTETEIVPFASTPVQQPVENATNTDKNLNNTAHAHTVSAHVSGFKNVHNAKLDCMPHILLPNSSVEKLYTNSSNTNDAPQVDTYKYGLFNKGHLSEIIEKNIKTDILNLNVSSIDSSIVSNHMSISNMCTVNKSMGICDSIPNKDIIFPEPANIGSSASLAKYNTEAEMTFKSDTISNSVASSRNSESSILENGWIMMDDVNNLANAHHTKISSSYPILRKLLVRKGVQIKPNGDSPEAGLPHYSTYVDISNIPVPNVRPSSSNSDEIIEVNPAADNMAVKCAVPSSDAQVRTSSES